MTTMMEWERIDVRNQIKDMLVEGIKTAETGDKQDLKTSLEYIHNELGKGYTVTSKLGMHRSFTIGKESYSDDDKLLVIRERGQILMVLYKCRIKNKTFIHYDDSDFMTRAEKKKIASMATWFNTSYFDDSKVLQVV